MNQMLFLDYCQGTKAYRLMCCKLKILSKIRCGIHRGYHSTIAGSSKNNSKNKKRKN